MAFPTAVNDQIADAVADLARLATQHAALPSEAMLDAVMVQTIGSAMHNAVGRQHGAGVVGSAAVAAVCARMLSIPVAPAPPSPGIGPHSASARTEPGADNGRLRAQLDESARTAEAAWTGLDEIMRAAGARTPSGRAGNGPEDRGDLSAGATAPDGRNGAYRSVAQSVAIAAQDAADLLRNVSTVSTTAQGVAMALLLATRDPVYGQAIAQAQQMLAQATGSFRDIGLAAAAVLRDIPSDRADPGP